MNAANHASSQLASGARVVPELVWSIVVGVDDYAGHGQGCYPVAAARHRVWPVDIEARPTAIMHALRI